MDRTRQGKCRRRATRQSLGTNERRTSNVYRVTCTKLVIPDWAIRNAPKGFSRGADYIWVKHRGVANKLAELDQEIGGLGEIQKVEIRRCLKCGRIMFEQEAEQYRLKQERRLPQWCGEECQQAVQLKQSRREGRS